MRTFYWRRAAACGILAAAATAGCVIGGSRSGASAVGALRPADLRCENLANPAGLTERVPRLSWRVESDARGQVQSAYRILVASSPDILRRGEGDLWDTGRVEGDATRDHAYTGAPLVSRQACWWSVQVWDRKGRPSDWNEPAEWSMGLLDTKDWSAEWIGLDAARPAWPDEDFGAAKWIGFPGDPDPAPIQPRWFVRTFDLADAPVSALLRFTSDDRGAIFINGERVLNVPPSPEAWKRAMRADNCVRFRSLSDA